MSVRSFRLLLVASVITGILAGIVDLAAPALLTEGFRRAQDAQDATLTTPRLLLIATLGGGLVVMLAAAIYGLYRLRSWAPWLALVSTALALVIPPAAGALAQSGYAISLSYLASYLWAIVLYLAFVPPFSANFRHTP